MFVAKGFLVQIVTDNTPGATVIRTLGNMVVPIFKAKTGAPTISTSAAGTTSPAGADRYWIAQYLDEPGFVGGGVSIANEGAGSIPENSYTTALNRLLSIAPVSVSYKLDTTQYSQYYLRLMNDSGYYIVSSNTIIATNGTRSMRCYKPDGTSYGTNFLGPTLYVQTYSSSISLYADFYIVGDMNTNGTLTNVNTWFAYCQARGSSSNTIITQFNLRRITSSTNVTPFNDFWSMVTNKPEPQPSPDPYNPGGTTGPGGGTGTHDPGSSDPILFNVLPEVSAVGTGFLSLWSPTEQQMLDLSEYMWNANPLTLDFWRRLIADPIQLIYGLNIIPLSLYDAGLIGGTESVVVGMINTGIKMDYLTSQWVELDCGTIDIEETWGAYLDYDPYTKLDIYLPYIGYRPLRVDDFMPGTIHVKYKIDLLTGACCAQILSTKSDEHGDTLNSIIYQFTGNCATQIPVTATQYADAVRSAISLAAAIGTVALLAGAGAPAAGAAGAAIMPGVDPVGLLNPPGMVPVDSELFGSMSQYNFMTAASDTGAALKSAGNTLKNVGMIHAGASAAENVMGIKPSVQRSGAIGGAAGMLGTQTPYLIFTRPRQAIPENQSRYTGYPSFMTKQLSELEGFTQIQSIHLEGIPCTANELAEIDALLKSGVIF